MLRLVRNVALGAAVITVGVAVWRDYGLLVTLKRAAVAYLTTFFVAGGLALAAVAGLQACRPPEPPPEADEPKAGRKRRRTRPASAPPADPAPAAPADPPPAEAEAVTAPADGA